MRILFFLFLLSGLASVLPADTLSAQEAGEKVGLNFRDADIRIVAQAMGDYSGRTILLDQRVKGKLTIIATGLVPREIVYDIFLSSLRLNGFAAIESGAVIKIIPEAEARSNAGEVYEGTVEADGDRAVTQIYALQKERASDLATALKPLMGPNGVISAYDSANTLVIADYAGNVRRLDRIISNLDQWPPLSLEVVPLKHVSAGEFIAMYDRIYLSKAASADGTGAAQAPKQAVGQGAKFSIVADTRTNSLVIRSEHSAVMERIRDLAGKIDTPASIKSSIHYVKLNFADAKAVASALNGVIGGQASAGSSPGGPKGGEDQGRVMIQADEQTKALLISAPDALFESLKSMIEKLDSRRKQIYVEALIAEISSDKAAELGVQWQSIRGFDGSREPSMTAVGSANLGPKGSGISDLASPAALGSGLSVGIISGTLALADGTVIPNILALAHALETVSSANILSTPTLLALDNEQAKIIVGQNVPLVTGSYASTGAQQNSVNPFQTYDRKDIGLTLRIKPQISDHGTIRLDIYQEVSSLLPITVKTGASDVVTNKRSLESTVLVEDGQIIVLGGLIQDNLSDSVNKVPILGDLPILGQLFRYETKRRVKTNLMVFLRPFIIQRPNDLSGTTSNSYEYIMGEQGDVKVGGSFLLSNAPDPKLPPVGKSPIAHEKEITREQAQ
ncbi:MAG: type II secretion system secretin GspD [Nitrospinae bacterium]|nr:type II secretion system secretin GspD [Nitrospinota bacterium]